MLLTLVGAVVGAIVGSILTWYLQRRWTHDPAAEVVELRRELAAMRQQFANFRKNVEAKDKEELDWAERFERLVSQLTRINPGLCIRPPGQTHEIGLYGSIFSDAKFREALENYIVCVNIGRTQFSPRNPRPDELRRTNFRETIERAEKYIAEFQKDNPDIRLKNYFG